MLSPTPSASCSVCWETFIVASLGYFLSVCGRSALIGCLAGGGEREGGARALPRPPPRARVVGRLGALPSVGEEGAGL